MRIRVLGIIALLLGGAGALFWLGSRPAPPPPGSAADPGDPRALAPPRELPAIPESAPPAAAPSAAASRPERARAATAEVPDSPAHAEHDHAPDDRFAMESEWYAKHPMSAVPHQVVRGWGAAEGSERRGVVGVWLVVDPNLPTEDLEQLVRDVYDYHSGASELMARVLDSEEAATYDQHVDGGALRNLHKVATVRRNPKLGVDSIEVRGERIDP